MTFIEEVIKDLNDGIIKDLEVYAGFVFVKASGFKYNEEKKCFSAEITGLKEDSKLIREAETILNERGLKLKDWKFTTSSTTSRVGGLLSKDKETFTTTRNYLHLYTN